MCSELFSVPEQIEFLCAHLCLHRFSVLSVPPGADVFCLPGRPSSAIGGPAAAWRFHKPLPSHLQNAPQAILYTWTAKEDLSKFQPCLACIAVPLPASRCRPAARSGSCDTLFIFLLHTGCDRLGCMSPRPLGSFVPAQGPADCLFLSSRVFGLGRAVIVGTILVGELLWLVAFPETCSLLALCLFSKDTLGGDADETFSHH